MVREVVAIRTASPPVVDGRLDEAAWGPAEPATSFIQQEPAEGTPATRQTQVRLLYDDRSLYIGARLFDEQPGRLITDELQARLRRAQR